jgi:MFS family permease
VAFFSQWVGNGIISYYLAKILTSVGITDPTAQAGFNGGLQIFNWIAAVAGSLASERLGRRFLWLTSACGMLASFIVITACSAVYAKTEAVAAGRAVMAFLFVYFGFYDIAFTGLTVSYVLEILPFALRAQGLAVSQFFIFGALFFNQYVNPIALDALAWKYYFVYIGVLMVSIVCIYFFYPETKGRMLEDVAEIFDGPSAVLPSAQANPEGLSYNGKHEKEHEEERSEDIEKV